MIRALYISPRIEKLERIGSIFDSSSALNIYVSTSVGDALDLIDFERYDAIILDCEETEKCIGSIEEIRERLPFVPLIVVAGDETAGEIAGFTNAGADFFLLPCDPLEKTVISSAISTAIEKRRAGERQKMDDALIIASVGIWTLDCVTGEIGIDDTGRKHLNIENQADRISLDILKDTLHSDDYTTFIKHYYKLMNKQIPLLDIISRVRADGGGDSYIRMKAAVSKSDDRSEPVTIIGTTQDISEICKARLHLMEIIDNLKLMAKISRHDIINQVTALDSIFVLLETEFPKKDHVERAFNMVHEITDNIKRQIVFSRIYHNLRSYEPEWIDLKEAVLMSGIGILPNRAVLNTELENVQVYADPMFEKVFYNLFENSIRHGKHVNEIKVSSREDSDGSLVISVRDNGAGIPDDMKEAIFRNGIGSNTGLGLFLVSEILNITDISIIEKGRYGEGAEFEIRVPPGKWVMKE